MLILEKTNILGSLMTRCSSRQQKL